MGEYEARQRVHALLDQVGDGDLASAEAVLQALASGNETGVFGAYLGLETLTKEPGRCAFRFEALPHLDNPHGFLHGGVLFSALDTAMGGALMPLLKPGERCTTLEAKINFLSSVGEGPVLAEAEVVHKGSRVAVLEGRARTEDGRLIALMIGTFYIVAAG